MKSDIIFVLDSSGSIGRDNYENVVDLTYNFTSSLEIGPEKSQIGVIIFSYEADVLFNLTTYQAIQSIPYLTGGTNTSGALRAVIGDSGFPVARLDDPTVFRLAIVLTDGRSNRDAHDTIPAAKALHEFTPSILVYVIGVTDDVNFEELNAIATAPEFVTHLDSFDSGLLDGTQQQFAYQICFTGKTVAYHYLFAS